MAESTKSSQAVVAVDDKTSIQPSVEPSIAPRAGRSTESLKMFANFIGGVRRMKFCRFFLRPVEKVGFSVPNYYGIVQEPMDIDTIRNRLRNQYYYSVIEAFADLQLLLRNCFEYNDEYYDCYKCGLQLKLAFHENLLTYPEEEKEILPLAQRHRGGNQLTVTAEPPAIEEPPLHIVQCKELLKAMKSLCRKSSKAFAKPLDMKRIHTGDLFSKVIREPIDLLTIATKIKFLLYKDVDEFEYDMNLIYLNGLQIYHSTDKIYKGVVYIRETLSNLFSFHYTYGRIPNEIEMPFLNTPWNMPITPEEAEMGE